MRKHTHSSFITYFTYKNSLARHIFIFLYLDGYFVMIWKYKKLLENLRIHVQIYNDKKYFVQIIFYKHVYIFKFIYNIKVCIEQQILKSYIFQQLVHFHSNWCFVDLKDNLFLTDVCGCHIYHCVFFHVCNNLLHTLCTGNSTST